MKTIVLGIHCGYMHDSNAALIIDGEVRADVLQERVSRIKKDPYFPQEAILKCLELGKVKPKDVNLIAVAAKDIQYQPYSNSVDYFNNEGGYFTVHRPLNGVSDKLYEINLNWKFKLNRFCGNKPFGKLLQKKLHSMGFGRNVEMAFYDHHDCHASSVYFLSGAVEAEDGYVFVIDAYGDAKSVSVFRFSKGYEFPAKILEMASVVSPGIMYSSVTRYLGMKPSRHEGKVTGLAGYGDPEVLYDRTEKFLRYNEKIRQFEIPCMKEPFLEKFSRRLKILLKLTPVKTNTVLDWMKVEFEGHTKENIAAAVQKRFDTEIAKFIEDIIGSENPSVILLAGGIFANVKTNALVSEMYKSSTIVVHPGMTDEGVGLGAAFYADYKINNHKQKRSTA